MKEINAIIHNRRLLNNGKYPKWHHLTIREAYDEYKNFIKTHEVINPQNVPDNYKEFKRLFFNPKKGEYKKFVSRRELRFYENIAHRNNTLSYRTLKKLNVENEEIRELEKMTTQELAEMNRVYIDEYRARLKEQGYKSSEIADKVSYYFFGSK